MKASDAKKLIGKEVKYKKAGWDWQWRCGVVRETRGKNIRIDQNWEWASDIFVMVEVSAEAS